MNLLFSSNPSLQDIVEHNKKLVETHHVADAEEVKGRAELEAIWGSVAAIDKAAGDEMYALCDLLLEYKLYLLDIINLLDPKSIYANMALTPGEGAGCFNEGNRLGQAEERLAAKKFAYGAQKSGMTPERIERLETLGYSKDEILSLMMGVSTAADQQIVQILTDEPPDYSQILDVDPHALSPETAFGVYYHSYILGREGNMQELEDLCNGMLDYSDKPNQTGFYSGRSDAYLTMMAAGAHAHAVGCAMTLAVLEMAGNATEEEMAAANNMHGKAMEMSSLWDSLCFLKADMSVMVPWPEYADGFRISGLAHGGQDGFDFQAEAYVQPYHTGGMHPTLVGPTFPSVEISTCAVSTAAQMNHAAALEALREIEEAAQELMADAALAILGVVCSVNPALAGAFAVLKCVIALAESDGPAAMEQAGKALKGLGTANESFQTSLAGAFVQGLAEVFKVAAGLEALDAERQAAIQDYLGAMFYWGSSMTLNGQTYVTFRDLNSVGGIIAMALQAGGGVAALYAYSYPETDWPRLAELAVKEQAQRWKDASEDGELTLEQKYFLYGADSGVSMDDPEFSYALYLELNDEFKITLNKQAQAEHEDDPAYSTTNVPAVEDAMAAVKPEVRDV